MAISGRSAAMKRMLAIGLILVWSSAIASSQTTRQPTKPGDGPGSAASQPARSTQPEAPAPARRAPVAAKPASPAPNPADMARDKKAKEEADALAAAAAAAKVAEDKKQVSIDVVHEWFIRWNALGENTPEAIDRFVELYAEGASHEVGPNERQASGPVYYRGQNLIRRMASDYASKWMDIAYAIAIQTRKEKSSELIATAEMPWGNTELAVEYLGGQTDRESKKRFMVRASAFFEIQEGKILRVRIYMPREEISEVTGPFTIM